jgi:hypothetical protein
VLTSAAALVDKVNKQGMSRTLMNFAQAASIAQKFQDIDKDFQLILQKVQFAISLIHYDNGTRNSSNESSSHSSSSGWKVGDELSSDFHEHKLVLERSSLFICCICRKKNKGNDDQTTMR